MTRETIRGKFPAIAENESKYPEFAKRLTAAMQATGITVTNLKDELKITYEMARRYTLGIAMPRDDKLITIAVLVGTNPAFLKLGTEEPKHFIVRESAVKYGNASTISWPLKKATADRIYALTPAQAKQADIAFDAVPREYEAQ